MQTFTILHVEDDPNDVLLVERAFKKSNWPTVVRSVIDGDQAVCYLNGEQAFTDRASHPFPDVVLLDLKMPRKSGLEFLTWMRQQAQFKRLPVVVFT